MRVIAYQRRKTWQVSIGKTMLGSRFPIRIQSMADTNTLDTKKSIMQAIRLIDAGAEYVRFTAQNIREAENLKEIKTELQKKGYHVPLIADVHFNPKIAEVAAQYIEKVRINPGNYARKDLLVKHFSVLMEICKSHQTAIRIGVNHGSLSKRMLNKYGDTPIGMVESCMEFLRLCKEANFKKAVVSIKSSNTVMMIKANRLLVEKMKAEGMHYPIHLGVTEAGEGADGRMKSAVGIGTLLKEGIGDTIRVSLTETPENELPFAHKLVELTTTIPTEKPILVPNIGFPYKATDFSKRETHQVRNIGSDKVPVVILKQDIGSTSLSDDSSKQVPDFVIINNLEKGIDIHQRTGIIIAAEKWVKQHNIFPLLKGNKLLQYDKKIFANDIVFVACHFDELQPSFLPHINRFTNTVLLVKSNIANRYASYRSIFYYLHKHQCKAPVIFYGQFAENQLEDFQIKVAVHMGGLFVDGLGNGIFLENKGNISQTEIQRTAFNLLQATRTRITKTEFISCPGCGRTLFDIQEVTNKVKIAFGHLHHLKIAVMGCIVNGIGEMGDADYGYVGVKANSVHLYKGKKIVACNVPADKAIEVLKKIIKINNDWITPDHE